MKVILTQDVKAQGKKGQMIEVSDGYARNFLLPKNLAVVADAAAMNDMKNKENARLHKIEVEKQEARDIAAKLEGVIVKIFMSAGDDGRLFGSVTSKEIADELAKKHGIEIDKRKINMQEPIKAYGTYTLEVKLYPEITGKFNVVVTNG